MSRRGRRRPLARLLSILLLVVALLAVAGIGASVVRSGDERGAGARGAASPRRSASPPSPQSIAARRHRALQRTRRRTRHGRGPARRDLRQWDVVEPCASASVLDETLDTPPGSPCGCRPAGTPARWRSSPVTWRTPLGSRAPFHVLAPPRAPRAGRGVRRARRPVPKGALRHRALAVVDTRGAVHATIRARTHALETLRGVTACLVGRVGAGGRAARSSSPKAAGQAGAGARSGQAYGEGRALAGRRVAGAPGRRAPRRWRRRSRDRARRRRSGGRATVGAVEGFERAGRRRPAACRARRPRPRGWRRRRPRERSRAPPSRSGCGAGRCRAGWRGPGAAAARRPARRTPSASRLMRRCGRAARASLTASSARRARSTGSCSGWRSSPRRASSSRSSTITPMRLALLLDAAHGLSPDPRVVLGAAAEHLRVAADARSAACAARARRRRRSAAASPRSRRARRTRVRSVPASR